MKRISQRTLAGAIMLCAALDSAHGGCGSAIITPPPADDWDFRITPYGWLAGIEGSTGVGPLVADVDASFGDLLEQLEMATALQFEARKGRWGIIADGLYVELGAEGSTPGPIYDNAEVEMKQFTGELTAAYRIYESPSGSVDLYAGIRYNGLSLDFDGTLDPAGIQSVSDSASDRIVSGIGERAKDIVQPKADAYKTAAAAKRTAIEAQVTSAIEAEADGRVKRDLEKQLVQIRRDGGLDVRDIASNRIVRAVKNERLALARSTAQLEVAQLKASVDATQQGLVSKAQDRVDKAEQNLAAAINKQLTSSLPTSASADKDWVDPIFGVRAQWNINDKWYLAGKSDIGGFGVGSDLAWAVQGTVGYNFTEKVSSEIGYRFLQTDYEDGSFTYDIAEHGFFLGLNVKF